MSEAATATTTTRSRRIEVDAAQERIVHVDRISGELVGLWGDISQQVEEQSGQIPLRTSILTLIIVAQGRIESRIVASTLHELVEQMPSRAIVIEIGKPGTTLDASISAHCRYLEAGRAACYEVIELRAPSDQLTALPSLLLPLELYDVPSFMWWVGAADFASPAFTRLTASAERIIIDSSRFDSALAALAAYHRYLQQSDTACTGTDLNWARATSWRELIAQSFDHPITQGLLPAIQSVDLAYDPSAEAQAVLLAGWLATRLRWRLVSATRTRDTTTINLLNQKAQEVTVTLSLQSATGVGLRSVRILAGSGLRTSRITVRRRSERLSVVTIEAAGMPRQERVLRDTQPRLCDLLGRELLIHTRDRVFDESLDFVSTLVQMLATGGSRRG